MRLEEPENTQVYIGSRSHGHAEVFNMQTILRITLVTSVIKSWPPNQPLAGDKQTL